MNLSTTDTRAGGAPAMNPTIRHKPTSRARRVPPRSVPYGQKLTLSKAQERTLLRLFVDTRGARPDMWLRVTTLASVTPWAALRPLARKGAMVVLGAPRFERVFGEPGWECILTSRGYAALRAALAREAR
jgi:hypothetical protein